MPLNVRGSDSLYWKTGLNVEGLKTGTAKAKGILAGFSSSITKMDIFVGLTAAGVAAFAKLSSAALAFQRDFESSMAEVASISEAVSTNFGYFSDEIVRMSRRVPIGAQELSKAYYQTISAGYEATEALTLLESAAKGAVAGVTDTKTAVDGLTTVLNAWNLSAKDSTIVLDVFFNTVKRGKVTFGELASSIARVAPIASATGISIYEVFGAMQTLTKQGTTAEEAITNIRMAIVAMNQVFGMGWAKTMTFQEGLIKIRDIADKSGKTYRDLLGRVQAVTGMLAMTGENAQKAADDLKAAREAAGEADDAFKELMKSLDNQIKILENWATSFLKIFGTALVQRIKLVGDNLKRLYEISKPLSILWGIQAPANIPFIEQGLEIGDQLFGIDTQHIDTLKQQVSLLKDHEERIRDLAISLKNFGDISELNNEQQTKFNTLIENLKILAPEYAEQLDNIANKTVAVELANEALNEIQEERKQTEEELRQAEIEHIKEQLETYEKREDGEAELIKTLKAKAERLKEDKDAENELLKVRKQIISLNDIRTQKIINLQNQLFKLTENIKDLTDAERENIETVNQIPKVKDIDIKMRGLPKKQPKELIWEDWTETLNLTTVNDVLTQMEKAQGKILSLSDSQISRLSKILGIEEDKTRELLGQANIKDDINKKEDKYYKNAFKVLGLARDLKNIFDGTSDSMDNFYSILNSAGEVLEDMEVSIGDVIDDLGNLDFSNLSMGSYLDILNIAFQLADLIFGLGKTNKQMKSVADSIIKAAQAMEKFAKGEEYINALVKEWAQLEKYGKEVQNHIEIIQKRIEETGQYIQHGGHYLKYWNKELEKIDIRLAEMEEEMKEIWTATTPETIADSIVEGFEQGLTAAENFTQTFEEMMRQALLNAFKRNIITKALEPFWEVFAKFGEGGYSEWEIKFLKRYWDTMSIYLKKQWKNFEEFLGSVGLDVEKEKTEEEISGMVGAISGITEETAGLIAGQLNAMRMNIKNTEIYVRDIRYSLYGLLTYENAQQYTLADIRWATVSTVNLNQQMLGVMENHTLLLSNIAQNTDANWLIYHRLLEMSGEPPFMEAGLITT